MSGSAATEKHVDLPWCEITRTNLESTRKLLRPALTQQLSPRPCSAPVSAATRFRYSAARWVGVHLVRFLIASRSLRTGEHLTVGLKRQAALVPPVKERWIVPELQQRGSNLLRFWHLFVRGVKAGYLVCTFGICQVPQPPDISIAHFESSCADVQDITTTHLRGTGEGNDAAQMALRAIFSGHGV